MRRRHYKGITEPKYRNFFLRSAAKDWKKSRSLPKKNNNRISSRLLTRKPDVTKKMTLCLYKKWPNTKKRYQYLIIQTELGKYK